MVYYSPHSEGIWTPRGIRWWFEQESFTTTFAIYLYVRLSPEKKTPQKRMEVELTNNKYGPCVDTAYVRENPTPK